jgi:formate/nitrite transporter FocA (FNT family)
MPNEQEKVEEEIYERTAPPGDIVYHAIQREGEDELKRRSLPLAWSGLAAGLSMGFSFLSEGLLKQNLPEEKWSAAVYPTGYSIGFLIVILGRQQLFTKDTLTAMLPLLRRTNLSVFINVSRLWITVLVTNLVGAFVFAWVIARTSVIDSGLKPILNQLGREAGEPSFGTMLLRGIFAGWLIAIMAWLLPFAESARVWVIIILAYLVGFAQFPHIVAGAVKAFYLVALGELSPGRCFGGFIVPALIGNVIGGVLLVALLAHAQFMAHEHHKK